MFYLNKTKKDATLSKNNKKPMKKRRSSSAVAALVKTIMILPNHKKGKYEDEDNLNALGGRKASHRKSMTTATTKSASSTSLSVTSKTVLPRDGSSSSFVSMTSNKPQPNEFKSCLKKRNNNSSKKPSRCISFNERIDVHTVKPLSALLRKEEDIQKIWYTADELNEIKSNVMALVVHAMKFDQSTPDNNNRTNCTRDGGSKQNSNNCVRGLERQIHSATTQARISVAIRCVVDGQRQFQRGKNNNDNESRNRLARVYIAASSQSLIDAIRRGTMDSVAAASSSHRSSRSNSTKKMTRKNGTNGSDVVVAVACAA